MPQEPTERRTPKAANVQRVDHRVGAELRARTNGHWGGIVWLTGLSGSGKSTIAMELERRLVLAGWQAAVLDGDNVRHGLCSDLGFSPADRAENIRRIGEVAHLFAACGTLVITAFISPYGADREMVRTINPTVFHEVYIATSLEECEHRDPKGLYRQARAGLIADFTGISAPYEPPEHPAMVLATEGRSVDDTVEELRRYVEQALAFRPEAGH